MNELSIDKLRALDEAATEAWTEYLTLGTPHPSVTLETRLRHAFMTGFCTARSQSDPAILAMAEELYGASAGEPDARAREFGVALRCGRDARERLQQD